MFLQIEGMTIDKISKLEELLPPDAMPVPMIEGLFAGLLSGPKVPPMSKIFEVVITDPTFNDQADAQSVFAILIEWWNGIADALLPVREGKWQGGELPLMGQRLGTGVHSALNEDKKQLERMLLQQWVIGFGLATQYAADDWAKLAFETDLLAPIMCIRASNWFGAATKSRPLDGNEADEENGIAPEHLAFLTDQQIDLIANYLPELIVEAAGEFRPSTQRPKSGHVAKSQADKNRAKRERQRHR